jgi:pre-mRNA-processing factor 19
MNENASANNDTEMAEDELPGVNDEVTERIAKMGVELSNQRKQRGKKLPEGLVDADTLSNFKQTACHTGIHSTGTPGITCLDLKAFYHFDVRYLSLLFRIVWF